MPCCTSCGVLDKSPEATRLVVVPAEPSAAAIQLQKVGSHQAHCTGQQHCQQLRHVLVLCQVTVNSGLSGIVVDQCSVLGDWLLSVVVDLLEKVQLEQRLTWLPLDSCQVLPSRLPNNPYVHHLSSP